MVPNQAPDNVDMAVLAGSVERRAPIELVVHQTRPLGQDVLHLPQVAIGRTLDQLLDWVGRLVRLKHVTQQEGHVLCCTCMWEEMKSCDCHMAVHPKYTYSS